MSSLGGKKILVGVTGGIAAYKVCTVVRLLKRSGATVRVVMTSSATEFVSPLTFSTLSGNSVLVSLFPVDKKSSTQNKTEHINLGLWADIMLIAPATANTIAELANGEARNSVSTTALSLRAPMVVSPAMDFDMYLHDATQKNISTLREQGVFIIPPVKGELASGLFGEGRLPEPEVIVKILTDVLNKTNQDLKKKKILVTAGPTFEPIDPVRFIGNRSSGKMGFALANASKLRGADVTLISGPVSLATPKNVKRINVETASEMARAILKIAPKFDAIIMSAAVSDFTPTEILNKKIKKSPKSLSIEIKPTLDILSALKNMRIKKIGFALETDNELSNAKKKLKEKNLDLIVLNSLKDDGAGFGVDTNVVTIINKNGKSFKLQKMQKFDVANEILNFVSKLLK